MENNNSEFKILCIDGGGIRGIIPATFLSFLEAEAQRKHDNTCHLYDFFDLICGTSTGGIIAIGLALGMNAKDILELYVNNANYIFKKRRLLKALFCNKSLYNTNNLKKLLENSFNNKTLRENDVTRIYDCKTRLCVPTYDLYKGEIHVFTTDHHEKYHRDFNIPVVDLALSTAAAPVYFYPHSFKYNDINSNMLNSYVNNIDGGVLANNPALIGLIEAHYCLGIPLENIKLFSLGTGSFTLKDGNQKSNKGIWYWLNPISRQGLRIYEVMASAQSINIDNSMKLMRKGVGNSNTNRFFYTRVQNSLDKYIPMDATDDNSLECLKKIGQELYRKKGDSIIDNFLNNKVQGYKHCHPINIV